MKIGMYKGKICLLKEMGDKCFGYYISEESNRLFENNMISLFDNWDKFKTWAEKFNPKHKGIEIYINLMDAPMKYSRQIFAIGMNYKGHTKELGYKQAKQAGSLDVFTKFPSALTGPNERIKLPGDTVDWEAELVVVIGKGGRKILKEDAFSHVAGFTVGQDITDRTLQFGGIAAQFSLGKSYEGFAPLGPYITTLDEIDHYEDLAIECEINGEIVQSARTSQMIYSIPELIERLSGVVNLYPGDLIFTGTPGGVGYGRKPKVYLKKGDIVLSRIEGLGEIRQEFV